MTRALVILQYRDLTIPTEIIDMSCPGQVHYIVYLLLASEADLNVLKDSISYLNASDSD
jgi:hypothetical protein